MSGGGAFGPRLGPTLTSGTATGPKRIDTHSVPTTLAPRPRPVNPLRGPCHPLSVGGDHPVDEAVFGGLLAAQEVVALGVGADLLERLAGVLRDDLVQAPAH